MLLSTYGYEYSKGFLISKNSCILWFQEKYYLDLENSIVDTGRKRLIFNYFLKMFGIYLGMVMFAYIMPGHGAPHIFV